MIGAGPARLASAVRALRELFIHRDELPLPPTCVGDGSLSKVGLPPEQPLGLVFPLAPNSRLLLLTGGVAVRSSIHAKRGMEPVAAPSVDEADSGQQGPG